MAGEPILIANNCALIFVDEVHAGGGAPNGVDRSASSALAEAIKAPVLDLSADKPFLMENGMRSRIAELNRRTLILEGRFLEGAVTQIALSCLLEGYEVYVCADQVATGEPDREEMYLDRIRYCNGHIVTTRQIILEILAQEKDGAMRAPLEALLKKGAAG